LIKKEHNDQIEILKAENEDNKKLLVIEKDAREKREWINKAEQELSFYPGKSSDELGEQLQKMHNLDPEMAKEQLEQMKLVSESFEKSDLLKENGVVGGNNTAGAYAKIEKAAEALRKADKDLTKIQALVKAQDENPELYAEYLNEG